MPNDVGSKKKARKSLPVIRKEEIMISQNISNHSLNLKFIPIPMLSEFQNSISNLIKKIFRKNAMHPDVLKPFNEGWIPPTNVELMELKKSLGLSTNELAHLVDINPKHLRNYFKDRTYIQGKRIQYTTWRMWLESFGYVKPLTLEPDKPFLRSRIFSHTKSEWIKPNISEVRVLVVRSGYSDSAVARILDLEEALIKHLLHSNKIDGSGPFHIEHSSWLRFLDKTGIHSLKEYIAPPSLPTATLKSIDDGFEPPNPKVLRQFIAWTGRTPEELAEYFGVESSQMKFFTTNRSARTSDTTINDRVFGVENWQAPTFTELRTFMKVMSLEPMEIAHRLKFSKQEMKVAIATRDNEPWKKEPMEVSQVDWFKLLDSLRVFNSEKIKKLTKRESKAYHIHYSTWRLMLQAFSIAPPLNIEKKQ